MKQKAKISFYGILAVLAIALVLGACPTDTPSKAANDTSKLRLSGQVFIQDTDLAYTGSPSLLSRPKEFKNDLKIFDGGLGGTGQIKKGQLSYSINVVPPLSPINEGGGLDDLKDMAPGLNLKFSPEDVNAAAVVLEVTDSNEYRSLLKGLLGLNLRPNIQSGEIEILLTIETVTYMYVDKNLNITANPYSYDYTNPELPFPITLTTEKINLNLKKGWNSLYSEITAKSNIPPELLIPNPNSPEPDLSALKPTGNLKMSAGDPDNLNWTLVPQSSDIVEPQPPEPPRPPGPY